MPASTTKYSEERIEKLLAAIRETGSIKSGWKAAGITKSTYYNWLNERPPLVQKIQDALNTFHRNLNPNLQELAMKKLEDYLTGKVKVVNSYEIERVETFEGDTSSDDGEESKKKPGGAKYISEKKKVETTMPTPQWVIERVLGRRLALNDALGTFQSYGFDIKQIDNGYLITEPTDANAATEGDRSQAEDERTETDSTRDR